MFWNNFLSWNVAAVQLHWKLAYSIDNLTIMDGSLLHLFDIDIIYNERYLISFFLLKTFVWRVRK